MSEELLYSIEYCNGVKVEIDFDGEFASAVRLDLPFVDSIIGTKKVDDGLNEYRREPDGNPYQQTRENLAQLQKSRK